MINKISSILKNKDVLNRILFTLVVLFVFKIGSTITVPRVDVSEVTIGEASDIFGLMNILGGGALTKFSIFALSVSPYITASIVIQLLSMGVLPALEDLTKQGAQGRKKLDNATRALTLLLSAVQAYGIIVTMEYQYGLKPLGGGAFSTWDYIYLIIICVAGTFLLMWMADQITAKGVGNGLSMIIFAGIITQIPYQISTAYATFVKGSGTDNGAMFSGVISFGIYLLAYAALVIFVVFMESSVRKIPMQYASTNATARTKDISYLPIKLNSAGVIPVIFASSILTAPTIIMTFLKIPQSHPIYAILNIGGTYKGVPWGLMIYIVLILLFTFFYTNIQLDPEKMAENFAKSGAYIPGIRPGKETEKHLRRVINRVTSIGALCLMVVAALPMVLTMVLNLPSAIAFGGTGLIIVVGVITETAKQIDGRLASKEYQGFID